MDDAFFSEKAVHGEGGRNGQITGSAAAGGEKRRRGSGSPSGAHMPPYGLNVFIPLIDVGEDHGPTEMVLGSHMWSPHWDTEGTNENGGQGGGGPILAHDVTKRFTAKRGSVVIMDYRTVHRGTVNRSGAHRPVLMLIFGRPWWNDVVNYGVSDYGGAVQDRKLGQSGQSAEVTLLTCLQSLLAFLFRLFFSCRLSIVYFYFFPAWSLLCLPFLIFVCARFLFLLPSTTEKAISHHDQTIASFPITTMSKQHAVSSV